MTSLPPLLRRLLAAALGGALLACASVGRGGGTRTGTVDVDGGTLAYDVAGSGPAVVLVHGGLMDRRMWDDQLRDLARDHRVVRYDLRGYGRSSMPTGSFSHVEDLHALLGALGVERATVVGLSLGGGIATDFALEHPERVRALVTVGAPVRGLNPATPVDARWGRAIELARTDASASASMLLDSLDMGSDEPAARERLRAIMEPNLRRWVAVDPRTVRYPEPATYRRLGQVRAPTLVVVGTKDAPAMHFFADTLAARIPGALRDSVVGGKHHPNVERPAEFNALLRRFLERVEREPPAPVTSHVRVSTVESAGLLDGPDGAAVSASGDVYVANWGANKGTTVVRFPASGLPAGRAEVAHDGFAAPDAVLFGPDGAMYVSNFASGEIHRIGTDGNRVVHARGLDHPSALAFGPDGLLYVSNFGNYDGRTVSRVRPDGTVETFASGFSVPLGLAFDRKGDLYVSNFGSGVVHRVGRDGVPHVFASVTNSPPARLQYLAFDERGTLYVPSYGHHRVYAIAPDGTVRTLAGDGTRGGRDGDGRDAQFDGPNSIALLRDGSLFVTEYNANRARRIEVR